MSTVPVADPFHTPRVSEALWFTVRATALRVARTYRNIITPVHRHLITSQRPREIVGESRSPLSSTTEQSRVLTLGKKENLRVAVRLLDGVTIPAGEIFSFWKQIGRPSTARGFVRGREIREGCVIPTVGGGLCQLSNALYDAALQSGCEILERHAHTRVLPGSKASLGKDATVFWNYVDLRFRAAFSMVLVARLEADELVVQFRSEESSLSGGASILALHISATPILEHDCLSCGVRNCFRHEKPIAKEGSSPERKTAYLVDVHWPEFGKYYLARRAAGDTLFKPLPSLLDRRGTYAWPGGGKEVTSLFLALGRKQAVRGLPAQGSSLQKTLSHWEQKLVAAYLKHLDYRAEHLVVQQPLLLPLHQAGVLGGRTYDVLMVRSPIRQLQSQLDHARSLHPDSPTLGDFRLPSNVADLEMELLRNANRLLTPHVHIASTFPNAELVPWDLPATRAQAIPQRDLVVYPAATLGRKGSYEIREAVLELGIPLGIVGPSLEAENFWQDVPVVKLSAANWLSRARVVVLPAFVEHQPRRILHAIAEGVPVIVSKECGVPSGHGVTIIPSGNAEALTRALAAFAAT